MNISKDTQDDISSSSESKILLLRRYSVALHVISILCFVTPIAIMAFGYGNGEKHAFTVLWTVILLSLVISNWRHVVLRRIDIMRLALNPELLNTSVSKR